VPADRCVACGCLRAGGVLLLGGCWCVMAVWWEVVGWREWWLIWGLLVLGWECGLLGLGRGPGLVFGSRCPGPTVPAAAAVLPTSVVAGFDRSAALRRWHRATGARVLTRRPGPSLRAPAGRSAPLVAPPSGFPPWLLALRLAGPRRPAGLPSFFVGSGPRGRVRVQALPP